MESFYRWAWKPYSRPVPGTGIGAFSSPSARRLATFGRSVEVVRKGQEWIWLPRRFR